MPTTIAHRVCPLCEACCGLEVHVNDGRVTSIRGHRADVFSAGYLCPKAVALSDLQDDPDRIRTPLIRRGDQFVAATWDEAFAEVEQRLPPLLATHGRDAMAVSIGNPAAHKMGLLLYTGLLAKSLGTRNVFSASTLDQMPKQLASGLMFGHGLTIAVPDITRTDLLIVLGANPAVSNGSLWTVPDFRGKARALRERGGRMVVIDPRRTETAALADHHLPIRPGGDAFLLLGLVHTLFDEGLVRLRHLEPHVVGLDVLREAALPFAPERVAERCGIAAGTVRGLARDLARADRAVLYGRMGTCVQPFGTVCSWLIDAIHVVTGHLDHAGGAMFPTAPAFQANSTGPGGRGRGMATGRHHARVSGAPEVMGELPITCMAEEMATPGPGQVRGLITVASNPVLSAPGGDRLRDALSGLEFMVSVDIYLNETTRHAHVIFPGVPPLEDAHYDVVFHQLAHRHAARFSSAVLPPAPGHRPEWEVLATLAAIAAGRGAHSDVRAWDRQRQDGEVRKVFGDAADAVIAAVTHMEGPERQLEVALRSGPFGDRFGQRPGGLTLERLRAAPQGIDLGPLKPRLPDVLRTPSGKVELAPAPFVADLARVAQDLHAPQPEFVLIGRRHVRSNNSWMHNLPTLAKGPARCTALMHPVDAGRLGVADGDEVRIGRDGGAGIQVPVEVSDEVPPGVVSVPHGWGHSDPAARLAVASARPGVNVNAVLDPALRDPLSGNAVLGGVAVVLTRADVARSGPAGQDVTAEAMQRDGAFPEQAAGIAATH